MAEADVALVEVEDPVVLLDGFPALAGGSLLVREGETVLVSGENGAGKSTLLRLLAGVVPLARGRAHVLGNDLARDRRRHRGRVAYVGHEAGLYGDLSVGENLAFFLGLAGVDADEAAVVDGFALKDLLDVQVARLSAGQRRRCSLALAFARRPALLLLDEPHVGLDADSRRHLNTALSRHALRGGATVVASHDLAVLARIDRHVEVTHGSITNRS